MSLFNRFIKYQHDRFPLRILLFTTLSSVLASVAVTGISTGIAPLIAAFFGSLVFVYHIRVIDESRDAAYDKKHYPERPVQQGLVSIRELFMIDVALLIITIAIAISFGVSAIVWTAILLVFTLLAWKDFFAPRFLTDKPMLYHLLNSPQMVIIQLFIYAVLTSSFAMTRQMWLLIGLMYILIFVLELVRKIDIKSKDNQAGDRYSKSMGFDKVLFFVEALVLIALWFFYSIILIISRNPFLFIIIATALALCAIISIMFHLRMATKTTEKFMLLSGLLIYICFNTLLFLSVI